MFQTTNQLWKWQQATTGNVYPNDCNSMQFLQSSRLITGDVPDRKAIKPRPQGTPQGRIWAPPKISRWSHPCPQNAPAEAGFNPLVF